jgi:hypothetical protein
METKPDRIDEVARLVESRIRGLFDEARDQINEAINVAVEDAQDDPEGKKEATVSLPIAVKWNLDRNGVNTSLAVTVKRKFEAVDKLEDLNQPTLPGIQSVTIRAGDVEVNTSTAGLRRGLKAVDAALAAGITPDEVSAAIKKAKASKVEGGAS